MTESEKLVMAHRYLYYVKCAPVISDREYDLLEKKALNTAAEDSPLHKPGSDLEDSYTEDVKSIAKKLKNI